MAVGGENDESECYIGKMALSLMLAWFFFFISIAVTTYLKVA